MQNISVEINIRSSHIKSIKLIVNQIKWWIFIQSVDIHRNLRNKGVLKSKNLEFLQRKSVCVCFVAVLHGPLNYADGKLFFAQKTVPLIRTDYAKVVEKKFFVRILNSYAKFTSRLECKDLHGTYFSNFLTWNIKFQLTHLFY